MGIDNKHLNLIRHHFNELKIISRGNKIKVLGKDEKVDEIVDKIEQIQLYICNYGNITENMIEKILKNTNKQSGFNNNEKNIIVNGANGLIIYSKTANQRKMVSSSEKHDITFAIGPAGSGKTYTAVALAVRALKKKLVKKIILTRPAVEAGENLGFLPGDIKDKVDPYLRPLYDALEDMLSSNKLNNHIENGIIEIAPLAFMRGRTLNNAFIILDEAQNATHLQLKMFLTRIGPSAKCMITGDLTQIDLPRNTKSGLKNSIKILESIEDIGFIYLNKGDVIRHKLVAKIIEAYEKDED